jgi:hypothetical protein
MKRWKIILPIVLIMVLLVGGVLWFVYYRKAQSEFFSKELIDKVGYTLVAPREYTDKQQASIKYDERQKNVSYVLPSGEDVFIVSIQALPSEFVNDQMYLTYVDQQNRVDKLSTKLGEAYIIRPNAFAGTEAATLRYKDALVFIRATQSDIEVDWESIVNSVSTTVN